MNGLVHLFNETQTEDHPEPPTCIQDVYGRRPSLQACS